MLDPKSAAGGPIELLAQMNAQLANSKGQLAEIAGPTWVPPPRNENERLSLSAFLAKGVRVQ